LLVRESLLEKACQSQSAYGSQSVRKTRDGVERNQTFTVSIQAAAAPGTNKTVRRTREIAEDSADELEMMNL
jgi:hypothetical protein